MSSVVRFWRKRFINTVMFPFCLLLKIAFIYNLVISTLSRNCILYPFFLWLFVSFSCIFWGGYFTHVIVSQFFGYFSCVYKILAAWSHILWHYLLPIMSGLTQHCLREMRIPSQGIGIWQLFFTPCVACKRLILSLVFFYFPFFSIFMLCFSPYFKLLVW